VSEIIERWGKDEAFLVEMLQDIQHEYRYIPAEAMETIAREVGVPAGRVYHLATFFKGFSLEPRGEHVVSVCMGTACHVQGAPRIVDACCRELGVEVGQTTPDGKFTVETVRCLGCCGLAAVVTVNDDLHGHVTSATVPRLLKRYKKAEEKKDE
jgi:NADH:ubiquinone oxidoreductase subunit E